jgi:hypothetical protein
MISLSTSCERSAPRKRGAAPPLPSPLWLPRLTDPPCMTQRSPRSPHETSSARGVAEKDRTTLTAISGALRAYRLGPNIGSLVIPLSFRGSGQRHAA